MKREEMVEVLVQHKIKEELSLHNEEELRKNLEPLSDQILQHMIEGLKPPTPS